MSVSPKSPAPLRAVHFDHLGLPGLLTTALAQMGITTAFPIQAATLPDSLKGRDVCGKAPTGSGKTLAFGLAVLSRIESHPTPGRRDPRHPCALVLVPTRELAAQIETDLAPLARAIGTRVTSLYGGVGYAKQVSSLRVGTDVLVACPGRLSDLIARRVVDMSHVQTVVLDEADRMADMGFLPVVRRLIEMTSPTRQILLFSATLGGPVGKLVRQYQRNPAHHDVGPTRTECGSVHHHFWHVDSHDRIAVTAATVSTRGPAMVFCRTKRGADRLSQRLTRSGLKSAALHGDRSQGQRDRALAAFRSGRLDVLVATDIAARGIHVDTVPLVIQFDLPADQTDYVHRAGRTGRAGADGNVVSLITHEQRSKTHRMQRKLGIPAKITTPNPCSLALIGPAVRFRTEQVDANTSIESAPGSPPGQKSAPGERADRSHSSRRRNRPSKKR